MPPLYRWREQKEMGCHALQRTLQESPQKWRLPCIFQPLGTTCSAIHLPSSLEAFLLLFSQSVMCLTLCDPHGLQHARPPWPSPSPRVCSNSLPLNCQCHQAISSSVTPFSCPQPFPVSGYFFSESTLHIRWPKYWSFSFSISLSNE